jgi:hypothetical protein
MRMLELQHQARVAHLHKRERAAALRRGRSDTITTWGTVTKRVGAKLKQLLLTSGPVNQKEIRAILALKLKYEEAEQMDVAMELDALAKLEQAGKRFFWSTR